MRIGLALRSFWKVLSDREAAERVAIALDDSAGSRVTAANLEAAKTQPSPAPVGKPTAAPQTKPSQNSAVTLLSALQRDARFVDLVYEDLDQYQDAQIGAAARPCLKQCRQSLDRLVKLTRVVEGQENETVEIDSSASPARIRWVGEPPAEATQAKLIHAGWTAASVDLPQWTGTAEDASVIAPAQVTRN